MRQEAEEFAELDQRRVQLVELKNQAESLFYSYNSTLKENSELIRDDLKVQLQDRKKELIAALKDASLSIEEIKDKLENFRQTLLSVGTDLYNQSDREVDEEFESIEEQILTQLKQDLPGDSSEPESEDEFSFNFDDDGTVSGDYEAVD